MKIWYGFWLTAFLWGTVAWAGALPKTISYQGYLKDAAGKPVTTATNLTFRLYSSTRAESGPLWSETRSATPANGVYSVELGSIAPLAGLPFDVQYYLGITVGGTDLTPRQPLTAAPYTMRAAKADNADSLGGQMLTDLDTRYVNPVQPNPTLMQIATLRWDQVRSGGVQISTGANPKALVYDGSAIWVANLGDNTVRKINPASGALGQPLTVGVWPTALVFDGTFVWVANQTDGTVQKINPVTGSAGAPLAVGSSPRALAFDGTNIWIALAGSNSVRKINAATGILGAPVAVAGGPTALAFDGAFIWVANTSANMVQKIDPTTNAVMNQVTVNNGPCALAFDGVNLWVASAYAGTVQKINPLSATVTGDPISVGNSPNSVLYDGASLWVANTGSDTVQRINPVTGATIVTVPAVANPKALAFDGANIWVANYSGTVMKLSNAGVATGVGTVATGQLADGAVATEKLADLSVTSSKLGNGSVVGSKLADGAITSQKIGIVCPPGHLLVYQNGAWNCGVVTTLQNAISSCVGASCTVIACSTGYADCDSNTANGCETKIDNDLQNCGACGNVCSPLPGVENMACSNGACTITSCQQSTMTLPVPPYSVLLLHNYADCDGNKANGCEVDLVSDQYHCGACGISCVTKFPHGGGVCISGQCSLNVCDLGYGDCDKDPSNGCETLLASSAENCGACGNNCNAGNLTGATCSGGICNRASVTCAPGFTACAGNITNGCVDLMFDNGNCGACGKKCLSVLGQATVCSKGVCVSPDGCDDCQTFDKYQGICVPGRQGLSCSYLKSNPYGCVDSNQDGVLECSHMVGGLCNSSGSCVCTPAPPFYLNCQ